MRTILTMMMFMMMNVIMSMMMMMMMMMMMIEEGRALPETHSGASFMRQCSSGIKNPIHIHQHDRHNDDDNVDFYINRYTPTLCICDTIGHHQHDGTWGGIR